MKALVVGTRVLTSLAVNALNASTETSRPQIQSRPFIHDEK